MRTNRIVVASCGLLAVSVVMAGHLYENSLYIDGKIASSDIKVIDGRSYVPVADVAKAMGYQINKRDDGLELIKAGGANQVGNKNTGKEGEEIFTGKWRFLVSKSERVKSYTVVDNNYVSSSDRSITAGENEDLVVVTCRIKNGTPNKDEIVFSPNSDGVHNALTDSDENSYVPIAFDLKATEDAPVGAVFNPGAAINFRVIFRIPSKSHPKDLIFTALRYSMRSPGDIKKETPQDIRITLNEL